VFPLTENGRSPAELATGGAAPPRVPVKVCSLARPRVSRQIQGWMEYMGSLLAEATAFPDEAAATEVAGTAGVVG
jgi:hypothetical protein